MTKREWVIGGVFSAAMLGYFVWDAGFRPIKPTPAAPIVQPLPPKSPYELAWVTTQLLVERQLKAPSTAKYGCDAGDPVASCVRDVGNGQYLVTGWVDSKNPLGVMMRADFRALIRRTASGDWEAAQGPELDQR